MSGLLSPVVQQNAFKIGVVQPGALLYTYLSGTSTPQATYNNPDLAPGHAHTNPVEADSAGVFPAIFLDNVAYRMTLTTSLGVIIWGPTDNVGGRITLASLVAATAPGVLIGRRSASAGTLEEITPGSGLAISGTDLTISVPGSDTQVLFNDGGAIGADSGLTFAKVANTLTLLGLFDISGASAGQIKFPATQNPSSNANTLDDYEDQGSWTPTAIGSSTAGDATYVAQVGHYIKVGTLVGIMGYVEISNGGTTTAGNWRIGGLPFTVAANWTGGLAIGAWKGFGGAVAGYPMLFVPANGTQIRPLANTTIGGTPGDIAVTTGAFSAYAQFAGIFEATA